MNKKRIWAILGTIAFGLLLLGLGYEWGRRQTPRFIFSTPALPGIQKISKKPLSELFNGFTLHSSLVTPEGSQSASVARTQAENYRIEIAIYAVLPQGNVSASKISELVPALPEIFQNFTLLMSRAELAPAFTQLYENKVTVLRQNLFYLERAISRQNFYDCETILQLSNPATGRRALLAIGPMDVNTDGSDGDRNVVMDKSSLSFQPTTSYRWPKTSKRPNPFVNSTEKELRQIKQKLDQPSEAGAALNQRFKFFTNRLRELKRWSFLSATADPFIVLPEFFFRKYSGPFAPQIGDFALVIYKGVAYPAIVGDAGPSYKFGEASLRLCQEISKTASGINRAVSSLRVAYLVFPNTALKPWQVPDIQKWNARCASLLEEMGGNPKKVFEWKNNIAPWPTPTPRPSSSPHPSATPTPAAPSPAPTTA